MDTTSYWIDTAPLPRFPALATDLEVDVVVIGAGITGITAAYLLKRAGRRVALLERRTCARIDTGHTTAHVTAVTDLRLTEIARKFGRDAARAVWDAGAAAIDQIVTHIRHEDIACEFRWVTGYLHAPLDAGDAKQTEQLREEASFARELAIDAEFVERIPFFGLPGIAFRQQALFHPRRYLSGLLQTIPGNGSHVFEETEVSDVENDATAVMTANGHRIRCRQVVVATHNPVTGSAGVLGATLFQSKLALYSTYAIGARIPAGRVPLAAYWDTNDPYYYLRIERGTEHDYAIFGGEDHKTGQETDTSAAYRRLEERLRRWLPEAQVEHRWSGQVIETNDGLPFIGEFRPNQFAATGFAGNGMTFGTLGAAMTVDAILGRANPWRDLFDPGRKKPVSGSWSYIAENKDYPYFLLRDWLGGSEGRSLHLVKPGEGKVLNLNGRKVAAYRNPEGKVTLCSPVCTHLKCIVHWNGAEHTWDCPCHGSRFKPDGSVISGPAETPLERLATPLE